jgi:signal peptidase I
MNREYFLTFLEIILLLLLVVLPVRFFLFEPFLVRGQSMEPNFHNLDYLIIDKLSYFFRQPQRGEVIVFKPPIDDHVYYIKRIIGLPGERIIIEESKITIFNKEHPEGFVLNESYLQNHYTLGKIEVNLGQDEYFVLGDNREVSYDSRKWGPVKKERITGRVIFQFSLVKLAQALTR